MYMTKNEFTLDITTIFYKADFSITTYLAFVITYVVSCIMKIIYLIKEKGV